MAALERSWSLITLGGAYAQHSPTDELAEKYGSLREKIRESLTRDSQSEGLEGSRVRIATAVALDALVYSRLDRLDEALAAACEALDFLHSVPEPPPRPPDDVASRAGAVRGALACVGTHRDRIRRPPAGLPPTRRASPGSWPGSQSSIRCTNPARCCFAACLIANRARRTCKVHLDTGLRCRRKPDGGTARRRRCLLYVRSRVDAVALGGGALNGTIDRPPMVRALALLSCCGIPFFERRVQTCLDGEAEGCGLI